MTADGNNTLIYNRLLSATNGGASGTYTYDGNSLRVKKVSGSTTVYIFSGSKVIAEYDNGAAVGSPSREYIYSGAQLLATISGGATTYHHPDHLSARVSTDSSGNPVRTFGHFPFGEAWYETGAASKWKFTSYERDSDSGNDYALMRTFVSRLARLSSPDPLSGSIADPQSLNRYAYVLNDPTNLADPSGETPTEGPTCLLDENGNCQRGGSAGGSCTIDGFAADCGMASGLVAAGAAVQLRPGQSLSGFINGHFYYLTAVDDGYDTYLKFSYLGLTAADVERLGLPPGMHPDSFLGFGITGGGEDSTKLRLVRKMDCQDSDGRHTYYRLQDLNGKDAVGNYTVSEHHTNPQLASSSDYPSQFEDHLRPGLFSPPVQNIQSFTISSGAGSPLIPVPVRIDGKDYGSLGVFTRWNGTKMVVLVNGQPAAEQRSTGRCPSPNRRQ